MKLEEFLGENCYIIADAGINHGGNIKDAKLLVDAALYAGVDAVKFQTFTPEELPFANITYDETLQIKDYCDDNNITFLSTPHSLSAIDFLAPIVPVFKIASPHITNNYFVERIRIKKKPVIASTGSITHASKVAKFDEVNKFLSHFTSDNLALLYCISEYPCYNFDAHEYEKFIDRYDGYITGLSCHSPQISPAIEAVKCGASIVEKHIKLSDHHKCVDAQVSLSPRNFYFLVQAIRHEERKL